MGRQGEAGRPRAGLVSVACCTGCSAESGEKGTRGSSQGAAIGTQELSRENGLAKPLPTSCIRNSGARSRRRAASPSLPHAHTFCRLVWPWSQEGTRNLFLWLPSWSSGGFKLGESVQTLSLPGETSGSNLTWVVPAPPFSLWGREVHICTRLFSAGRSVRLLIEAECMYLA